MSEVKLSHFNLEIQNAIKEIMLKFVGEPINKSTEVKMGKAISMIFDFYDQPYEAKLYFYEGSKIKLFIYKKGTK